MMANEPEVVVVTPRTTLGTRLAARLPEILIEALFVLVAVVLAFAVEEWREERELARLAEEAKVAILREVEENRIELAELSGDMERATRALEAVLAATTPAEREAAEREVRFGLGLITSAAWTMSQSTEASRRMNYAWMLQISQTYELQSIFHQSQWAAVDTLVSMRATEDPAARQSAARLLLGRIRHVAMLGSALDSDYEDILTGKKGGAPAANPTTKSP